MDPQTSAALPLNIEEVTSYIEAQFSYYHSLYQKTPHGRNSALICRVHRHIHEVDPMAYEPIFVSIGPYHHFAPSVIAMEREKWKCMKYILKINSQKKLEDYLSAIMNVEEQARSCYRDDINIESNKFIKLLLLDGCFLLHSLYATNEIVDLVAEVYEGRDSGNDIIIHEGASILEIQDEESSMSSKYGGSDTLVSEADKGPYNGTHADIRDDIAHREPQVNSLPTYSMIAYESNCITRDILILENQIPFFVVNLIYGVLSYKKIIKVPLTETFAKYMEDVLQYYPISINESNRPKEFHHLLHLCHIYFKPTQNVSQKHECQIQPRYLHSLVLRCGKYFKLSNQHENADLLHTNQPTHLHQFNQIICWRRAVQYDEAGVQFKRRELIKHAPHSLLDITFDRGVLQIPCLSIDDKTSNIFRNLIAFEQACPQFGNDLTAYTAFVCQLISTPDDVTFLCRRGVIVHHMRCDADVCKMFGKLWKNVDFDMNGNHYLKHLSQQLEEHYQSRINKWMAWLWKNHFSNPWMTLAVVAAAIVLICTILQTLFSLLAYINPAT